MGFWKILAIALLARLWVVECTWFKYQLKEADCDLADQGKCETSLYWVGLCKICRDCYNVCPECMDKMLSCKQMTAFTKVDCFDEDSEIYKNCDKTCGKCKCNKSVRDVHDNWECQQHFKRVAARNRKLKDEL